MQKAGFQTSRPRRCAAREQPPGDVGLAGLAARAVSNGGGSSLGLVPEWLLVKGWPSLCIPLAYLDGPSSTARACVGT